MPSFAPIVDASDIIRLVGGGAFERGRKYARDGAVAEVEWDGVDDVLTGIVHGSGLAPYRCRVQLVPARLNFFAPASSTCTCPLGYDCKHVAATMLFSNTESLRAEQALVAPVATGEPAWKRALVALAVGDSPAATATGMGLLFELRQQVRRSRSQWNAPVATTASAPLDTSAVYRLGTRPVVLSSTGNWVRGNLTWGSIGYHANRLDLRADQLNWFAQFAGLQRATRDVYTGQEADWIYLDDFASPLLWRLFEDARSLGIALVSGKRQTAVTVAGEAHLRVDVRASGDLRLEPAVQIDGLVTAPPAVGVIGDHGVYVFALEPQPQFTLAPTMAPIAPAQRELLITTRSVAVPKADADEFLRDYLPQLRRLIEVTSTDASVPLPELLAPVLVVTVTFAPDDVVALAWAWENGVGELPDVELAPRLTGFDAVEWVQNVLPVLEQYDDVRVELIGDRPDYRELTDVPTLTFTTVPTDKRDWFDLGVLVTVEGRTIPFAPLFAALTRGDGRLKLVDNSYLSLDQPVFDGLRQLIDSAAEIDEWQTRPRINRYQASLWAELEELADETDQAVSWREAVGGLNAASVEPTPVPELAAELRPYQQQGFDWLAFLYRQRLGGILADDMGLGKTLQTIALFSHAVAEGADAPFLVVAPTSVVGNWMGELGRFAPHLRAAGLVNGRQTIPTDVDVVVTSYALFRLNFSRYQDVPWSGLVLDEAQFIKNPASKAHECAVELRTPFKLALTGTPMENSLTDLWALFHVTAPGLFASRTRFTENWVKPIVAGKSETLATLRRRIRPLMMRRTKELVASDLPAKQEQVLSVALGTRHRALYDSFLQKERQKLLGLIDDLDRNRFIVFRSLTLLRLLSLDASLVSPDYAGIPSAKLDALFEQLDDVVAEGHRALVFSQFTSFLGLARERLDRAGIAYEYLDGSTLRRPEVIARFKSGTAPVFLISLKAGGFGLNLTEADYVFILDPWWNPATESQAVDRTHRIGQTRNVMVYRLVARDTIEEKVMALKEQKARLFDAVVDDDAVFSQALSAEDIRELLA